MARYEADLRADHFLVIAHGSPGEVEQARELLGQTTDQCLGHHNTTADEAKDAA